LAPLRDEALEGLVAVLAGGIHPHKEGVRGPEVGVRLQPAMPPPGAAVEQAVAGFIGKLSNGSSPKSSSTPWVSSAGAVPTLSGHGSESLDSSVSERLTSHAGRSEWTRSTAPSK